MKDKVKADQLVRHTRTQGTYRVLDFGLMKLGEGWKEAVIYFSEERKNGQLFIRELDAFIQNFEEVV